VPRLQRPESFLAQYTGAEAALTLSSGYLACQAIVQLMARDHAFMYTPNAHPALCRSSEDFYTGNFVEWSHAIHRQLRKNIAHKLVIVSNSLDPLLAEKYDFDWVDVLPSERDITLLIDDSHGFGITGENGEGIYKSIKSRQKNLKLIVVSSFGKALGIPGGLVISDKAMLQQFKKSPFFSGSSPIAPAFLHAFLHSQEIYRQARTKLFDNIAQFSKAIPSTNLFHYFENYPVFYTPDNNLYKALKDRCVLSSFSYPTPDSKPITRVVLNSLHQPEDIEALSQWILEYQQR
jgi:7-keto-8-aminopelargonate synthetase-like enzyme